MIEPVTVTVAADPLSDGRLGLVGISISRPVTIKEREALIQMLVVAADVIRPDLMKQPVTPRTALICSLIEADDTA